MWHFDVSFFFFFKSKRTDVRINFIEVSNRYLIENFNVTFEIIEKNEMSIFQNPLKLF